jgi:hypothetical protein
MNQPTIRCLPAPNPYASARMFIHRIRTQPDLNPFEQEWAMRLGIRERTVPVQSVQEQPVVVNIQFQGEAA